MEHGNMFHINGSDSMGAIFMCSRLTKKECFERKLFGLHSKHSNFVKLVKTGMILFLFETEDRKLNGIFRATSDGAMNIIPSAFSISKKRFPAQVRFERLYACKPLSENEFCEAIEENYFNPTMFTFALSSQQVCRLIWLFSSRSVSPYDQFPAGLSSESLKMYGKSNLARTRAIEKDKLLKFDTAGCNMVSDNIETIRKTISSAPHKNHLTSYRSHDMHDITLHSHMVQGQHAPFADFSQPVELRQSDQFLPTSPYGISREPNFHCSSSRPLHKQPDKALSTSCYDLSSEPNSYCSSSRPLHKRSNQVLSTPCYDLLTDHDYYCSSSRPLHEQPDQVLSTPCYDLSTKPDIYCRSSRALPKQTDQALPTPCYDPSSEPSSYSSSSRPLHKQPMIFLGMDHSNLGEKKLEVYIDGSLDVEASHMRNQSYTSPPHLGTKKYFTSTKHHDIDKSVFSPTSKPSQPTLHSPYKGHINIHDFDRNDFPDISHPPSGRLRTVPSPALCIRNARAYSQLTQQEGSSLSHRDLPPTPLRDYITMLENEMLVNSSYKPDLKDDVVDAKEAFKVLPIRNKHVYRSSFTNNTINDGVKSINNDKSSASYSNMFSRSDAIQKKCSVFGRLSPSSKELKYPSQDQMLELLYQRRHLWTKANRKPGISETHKADVQQSDTNDKMVLLENDSLTNKPQIEDFNENTGFQFLNFKRRSAAKQQSTGTPDIGKCKKRKIIRPSFAEENDSFKVNDSSQNQSQHGMPLSNLQGPRGSSSPNSLKPTLDSQSEIHEKILVSLAVPESSKTNIYDIKCDYNVDGTSEESLRDLPSDSLALSGEAKQSSNLTDVLSTTNACVLNDSVTNADMNHMIVAKVDSPGSQLCNRCHLETSNLTDICIKDHI